MQFVWSVVVLLGCLVGGSFAYPEGPPVDDKHPNLCRDMDPTGHGVSAMKERHPFEIVVASNCYKGGIEIPVYVRLNTTDGSEPYHEGLFVMARKQADNIERTQNVGTFNVKGDKQLKTLPCFSKNDSAVGQKVEAHMDCKKFYWKAPDAMRESIVFHGTIVRNKERYWKDVFSSVISYKENCTPDDSTVTCNILEEDSDEEDNDDDDDDDDDEDKSQTAVGGSENIHVAFGTWITSLLFALLAL